MKGVLVKNKKGVSPVIASIFLILMVFILASLIFLWARGFISEQVEKFGNPVEGSCKTLQFDVEKTGNVEGVDVLEVVNRGNVDIYNFEVKAVKGGNSRSRIFKFSVDAGESVKESLDLRMDDGSDPEKIIVYPALLGSIKGKDSNRVFTCLEQGITLEF